MNRITDIKHYKVVEEVETLLIHLEYPADEFDPLGNRKQMKRTLFPFLDGRFGTGSHVNYGYDKTSQLTAENYFRPATPNPLQFLSRTNTFDDSGNRLNLTENRGGIVKTIRGAFDEANGLEAETVRFDDVLNQRWQTVFERDLRGNTTKKTVPAGAGREKEEFNYEYNRRNNLTKVTRTKLGEQKEIGFQYNADGLRVEKSFVGGIGVSPVVKKFIMDGVHVILERDGEDETKVRYIPGICTIHNPTSENPIPRYDLHDALGSVIAQVSLDEDEPPVVWAAQYGAYGKTLAQSSKTPSPYQWVGAHGYYFDKDVGMVLMGYRWYDSFTGRFISRDPIGFNAGDMNLYRSMGNNPVNAVDPWGLDDDDGFIMKVRRTLGPKGRAISDALMKGMAALFGEEPPDTTVKPQAPPSDKGTTIPQKPQAQPPNVDRPNTRGDFPKRGPRLREGGGIAGFLGWLVFGELNASANRERYRKARREEGVPEWKIEAEIRRIQEEELLLRGHPLPRRTRTELDEWPGA